MKNLSMLKDRKEYNLLIEIEANLKKIYGTKLQKIILYGSYARNEQVPGSDLDVMVLLDLEEEEIREYSEAVLDLAVNLTTRYGLLFPYRKAILIFSMNGLIHCLFTVM